MTLARSNPAAPLASVIQAIREVVGPKGWIDDAADVEPYLIEERGLFHGACAGVVRPATTAEVAAVVAICAEAGVAVVPQGGNTGLVVGSVPDESGTQVVLSLTRMQAVRALDAANLTVTVEAGCILQNLQEETICQWK